MVNRLVVFDVSGKFACWKKYYSNSSNFTSYIPSRTQIIGIIASIMELPRDSYYEYFSVENCKIGIEILKPLKKTFHCMNYFKSANKRGQPTQVRVEILSGKNIKEDNVVYRFYLWFKDNEKFTLDDFITKIKNNQFGYGICLGQRQFRGDLIFINEVENITEAYDVTNISTVLNINNINSAEDLDNIDFLKEDMSFEFEYVGDESKKYTNNLNRELKKMGTVVYSINPDESLDFTKPLKKAFKINVNDKAKIITFLEDGF